MEDNRPLEVDIVPSQEGRNISEEVVNNTFKNVFTEKGYSTEREAMASYDALNMGFVIIDDIKADFGRMSNPNEIMVLQSELKKLMPYLDIDINGILNLKTERALKRYEELIGSM